ncbi:hypothetical protein FA13DRAFT_1732680 [Coprinellus micaceus]|uniref:DUF6699 domain-containing protein n=1 Tax=Coprinellus micaceus TaxID=71717 RepID=A0A4Y7TB65_COPMI|nr:hypothetical protein FA13DRAFT_1732680 [Coprinellus micaceus]
MSPMQMYGAMSPTRIHPILSDLHRTPLAYDLSPRLPFSQSATEPALPYLEITHPRLPWKLIIQPTVSRGSTVTVADILAGIHANLRTNVTALEFQMAGGDPMDPGRQQRVTAAYQARCSRIPYGEARNKELKKGLKRIDFLEGVNMFEGLANTKYGAHIWCLKTTALTS